MRTVFRCLPVLVLTGAVSLAAPVEFNRDIRPFMSDTCFYCHGPDKAERKAGLRLDDKDAAMAERDGIRAIVPGKPDESDAVARVFSKDPDELMPPPDSNKTLTPEQKELFKRWVAEGAVYQPHWAYVVPQRPTVPKIANAQYPSQNPIDAFISARLLEKKIVPTGEADRPTLLRRLSLDLIGTPPTPAEVSAFVADKSPNAFEKQVDRLLASPHYGERMAVPWLDAVRFSDTVGFHGDQNQRIFPYRDYVINAFNTNKPFDQFTREQLAGDLLPNPTQEQLIATGFNRLNMMTREGGAQPKEYLAKSAADRVRTVSGAWLGSTMACCECHDHKYDPYSLKDFYQLAAFFADVKQWGVYTDYNYTPNPELKGFTNEHPFPPEIEVTNAYLQARQAKIKAQSDKLLAGARPRLMADAAKRTEYERWVGEARKFLTAHSDGWRALKPEPEAAAPATASAVPATPAPSVASAPSAAKDDLVRPGTLTGKKWVMLDTGAMTVAAVRAELMPDNAAGKKSGTMKLIFGVHPAKGADRPAPISRAEATAKVPRYVMGADVPGIQSGWNFNDAHATAHASGVWVFDPPVKLEQGDRLVVAFEGNSTVPVRLSVTPFGGLDFMRPVNDELRKAIATNAADPLAIRYLWSTAWDPALFAEAKKFQASFAECNNGLAWTMVTKSVPNPLTVRVLPRGNWQDETGEIVQPGVPHFLPQPKDAAGRRLTRLDLANWLCAPDNPLTARVFMNRLWKQMFGNAISAQVEDVGAQGEWPSHPELLDWLAVEFRESRWDVKHMVRLLVTSAAYRRDSNLRRELRDVDPMNRLLATQNPRRLDAEFVRDNALSISGLLNAEEIGGPSAHPYQPARYYESLQFPNRDYRADTDDRQYRRGLYTHWQRTFLHPMMANFDAPSRDEGVCSRTMANTPQQALTLLNDPTFVECARVLAAAILNDKNAATDAARIDSIYQRALARPPKERERESLLKFLEAQRKECAANPAEAAKTLKVGLAPAPTNIPAQELAAWTEVCRVVLNLHETITRY